MLWAEGWIGIRCKDCDQIIGSYDTRASLPVFECYCPKCDINTWIEPALRRSIGRA